MEAFSQIRDRWKFNPFALAALANVEPRVIYMMIWNDPVAREEAERVLRALSKVVGQECSLHNVEVKLVEKEGGIALIEPDQG